MKTANRLWLAMFADARNLSCLVVGAGTIAERKIYRLLEAGARVTVVAPDVSPTVSIMLSQAGIPIRQRCYQDDDLDGQQLVVAATNDEELNAHIAQVARERNLPVNVAAPGHLSTVILPKTIDRTPIQIAITSGGASPALMRHLYRKLNSALPFGYGQLATLLAEYRARIIERYENVRSRRWFIDEIIEGSVAEQIFAGQVDRAKELLESALLDNGSSFLGEVYIVGAGPGDPDLLTVRAVRLMQKADVVVHDRLIGPAILGHVRSDAEKINVGKERDNHTYSQEEINRLLISLAREGKRVLRLKGGDPFVFGRGGEEMQALTEAGINFQLVPGITAASGCAAYAGIPLTHRDCAHVCVFLTGHLHDDRVALDWNALTKPGQTLVFYMGVYNLRSIGDRLLSQGMSPSTPAAIIIDGTLKTQQVIATEFGRLLEMPQKRISKALLIVGETVKFSEHYSPVASLPN